MNTFNRKTLYVAVAGVAAIAVAGTAQAVNVSENGLGQVLVYPYYTVKNNASGQAYNTLMSVVNTTASTKAVKVRFREGRNSVEVLDFNVFLSPSDVWTAVITPTSTGGGQVTTYDRSCTIPTLTAGTAYPFRVLGLESGDNADSRTGEGYIEVFEMATMTGTTAAKALHNKDGVPACGISDSEALANQAPPGGGLFGGVTIVNPAGGGAFSQSATALANFNPTAAYSTTGDTSPKFEDATPISSVIQGSTLYRSIWGNGQNAVSAVLMANAVTNEYVLDFGTRSQTSWIMAMPTKYAYVNGSVAVAPFTKTYKSKEGACEPTFPVVFNREEGSPQIVTGTDFSPQIPGAPGPSICWEVTAVNFAFSGPVLNPPGPTNPNIFGSSNTNTLSTPYANGWAIFALNDPTTTAVHSMTPVSTTSFNLLTGASGAATVRYYGLPVIGFAAQTFNNNALVVSGVSYFATFAADFVHRKTTNIANIE